MATASLLTVLAIIGVIAGVMVGQARMLSSYLAAAGGGLLFGISLFWLMPESAAATGWLPAFGMTAAACLILVLVDHLFTNADGRLAHTALGPILLATAIHSFLDGWSVRALAAEWLASIAAPVGLALHKIPEGLALGWIARRSLTSASKAALAGVTVELVTLVGAYVEPHTIKSGVAEFGPGGISAVFAIIGGSFLFLGFHAVLPNWRRVTVMLVFFVTFLVVGTIGLMQSGKV